MSLCRMLERYVIYAVGMDRDCGEAEMGDLGTQGSEFLADVRAKARAKVPQAFHVEKCSSRFLARGSTLWGVVSFPIFRDMAPSAPRGVERLNP